MEIDVPSQSFSFFFSIVLTIAIHLKIWKRNNNKSNDLFLIYKLNAPPFKLEENLLKFMGHKTIRGLADVFVFHSLLSFITFRLFTFYLCLFVWNLCIEWILYSRFFVEWWDSSRLLMIGVGCRCVIGSVQLFKV